jgi:tyrosyl-tRNA synthetase
MLAGRALQKKMGMAPQDIITVKLLVGTDGKEKMSKSLGNYVGVSEDPDSQFGKIMSIPDSQIIPYFELCSDLSQKEIDQYKTGLKRGDNPRKIKSILAFEIVRIYHTDKEAKKAQEEFDKIFSRKELPTKISEITLSGTFKLPLLLINLSFAGSSSEARRLVIQGAVKIDAAKITDPEAEIKLYNGMVIQVGKKRFIKISQ